jgi:acetyl esterase
MTRDRGGPPLCLQVPVYPVIDADFTRPSYVEWGDGPGLTRAMMEWYWDHYVDPDDRSNPYVSPLCADSLADVAPAFVVTAEADPLQSEGEAYADRLRADGVAVTHRMYPGMHHGFMNLTQMFPKAKQAFDDVVAALTTAFVAHAEHSSPSTR